MSKYIKVSGLDADFPIMIYEITATDVDSLIEAAIEHGTNDGSYQDVKVEIVEMQPSEFEKIEEAV